MGNNVSVVDNKTDVERFNKHANIIIGNVRTSFAALAVDEEGAIASVPLKIETDEEQMVADSRLKYIKAMIGNIRKARSNVTSPIEALKKRLISIEREVLKPLEAAAEGYKLAICAYKGIQEDLFRKERAEAERVQHERQQALLREAEEKERMALREEQVRREKVDNMEQQAKEARQTHTIDAEAVAQSIEQEARVIEQTPVASAQEAQRLKEEVLDIARQPIETKTRVVPVSKLTTRKNYCAQVVDISQLDRKYMIPDEKRLNQMARDHNGNNEYAPQGVKFVEKNN